MRDVEVSVICVTYNQKDYIGKCIESLISQKTNFHYEILVHDDASTDGTSELLYDFSQREPNLIKLFSEEENQYSKGKGNEFVRNLVSIASGKYIAFCEGDDYWCDPLKLQLQYDALNENPACSMCYHDVDVVNEDGSQSGEIRKLNSNSKNIIVGKELLRKYLLGDLSFLLQTSSYFIRSNVLKRMPLQLDKFSVGDTPMLLWSSLNGNIYYFPKIMSCYRQMSKGSTNQLMKSKEFALGRIRSNVYGFLAFNEISDGEYWDVMKHTVGYYVLQCYYGSKKKEFVKEFENIKTSLSLKDLIAARIKFTTLGNILRRLKRKICH